LTTLSNTTYRIATARQKYINTKTDGYVKAQNLGLKSKKITITETEKSKTKKP